MKYSVLIKRYVNIRVDGIEAHSQTDAIEETAKLNFAEIIGPPHPDTQPISSANSEMVVRYIEDGDQSACYLVDEEGDEEFLRSVWYASDEITPLDPGNLCSECLRPLPAQPSRMPA